MRKVQAGGDGGRGAGPLLQVLTPLCEGNVKLSPLVHLNSTPVRRLPVAGDRNKTQIDLD